MSFLYPIFLWSIIPLLVLFWRNRGDIIGSTHIIVLMLLVLSISTPVKDSAIVSSVVESRDIIIALDVSFSMSATDISPSRYEFAKDTILEILRLNSSDNITLIAFTTNPLLLSPPTTDHTLIAIALDALNPKYILTKGTSMHNLFKMTKRMGGGQKSMILITDGGEESDIDVLAEQINSMDISLSILALGSIQGTTISYEDGSLLKDKDDNLIISRINPILKPLAYRVNGSFVTSSSSPKATAEDISDSIKGVAKKVKKSQKQYQLLYQYPLFLAFVIFIMLHTRAIKYLIIIFVFLGVEANASFWDIYNLNRAYNYYEAKDYNTTQSYIKSIENISLESQIALASSYYKRRNYKKAITIYKSIKTKSPSIKQKLYYNIANSYAKIKSYNKAKIYYTKALQIGEDKDSSYNLKIIVLLEEKSLPLGLSHPQSSNSTSTKSDTQDSDKKTKEQSGSSGSGGGERKKGKNKKEKISINPKAQKQKHPLGSKVYELINKGYIYEEKPW